MLVHERSATPSRLRGRPALPIRIGRALALSALLAVSPSLGASADQQGPTVAGVLWDAVIERPISLAETAIGVGVAGVAYPLSLGSGSSNQVLERCVSAPARYTFTRELGRFEMRERSACSPVGFSWTLVKMGLSVVQRPLGLIFGDSPLDDRRPRGPREEIEVDGPPALPATDELEL